MIMIFSFTVALHDQSKLVICEEHELIHLLNNNKRKTHLASTKNKRKPYDKKDSNLTTTTTAALSSVANNELQADQYNNTIA